jgi:hypothetical protein
MTVNYHLDMVICPNFSFNEICLIFKHHDMKVYAEVEIYFHEFSTWQKAEVRGQPEVPSNSLLAPTGPHRTSELFRGEKTHFAVPRNRTTILTFYTL